MLTQDNIVFEHDSWNHAKAILQDTGKGGIL